MGDTHCPFNPRMLNARGNGKSSITWGVHEAVVRADVYQWFDWRTNTVHFYSKNQLAPLTDEEKRLIRNYLGVHGCPFLVVFDDCKYPLDISSDEPLPDWPKENPHINTDWCKPMEEPD